VGYFILSHPVFKVNYGIENLGLPGYIFHALLLLTVAEFDHFFT